MTCLPGLPDFTSTADESPKKILFVVPGVNQTLERDLIKITGLANLLANDNHEVSVAVWMPHRQSKRRCESLLRRELNQLVKTHYIPVPKNRVARGMLGLELQGAYNTYAWLKSQDFDIAHFHDCYALGFYCMVAKKAGLVFQSQMLSVLVDTPSLMDLEANRLPIEDGGLLVRYEMEKKSLEMADQLLFFNDAVAGWMDREGIRREANKTAFELPCFGIEYELSRRSTEMQPRELVFWGDLSMRSGFPLFCASLGRLPADLLADLPIKVFCNSPERRALTFARHQFKRLGIKLSISINRDLQSIVNHLQQADSLVYSMDTSGQPGTHQIECLVRGIPVVSLDCAANRSIYLAEHQQTFLFEPRAVAIAATIERTLGMQFPARLSPVDYENCASQWRRWHRQVIIKSAVQQPLKQPKVSICLMHHERPKLVRQAIESIEAQSYPNFEVILLDDGSNSQAAIDELKRIEKSFKARQWQVVVQENRYLGAARNTAVRHATGDYLYFLDDDNYLLPDAIETMVRAALHSRCDIVGAFSYSFLGSRKPGANTAIRCLIGHMGGGIEFGLFKNPFADSNSLVRRDFFNQIGGNTEDFGVGKDDQEFYARALLSGASMMVIPEPMYWARQLDTRLRHRHFNLYAGQWRVSLPYLEQVPLELRNILRFSQSAFNQLYVDVEPITLLSIATMIKRWVMSKIYGSLRWMLKLARKARS